MENGIKLIAEERQRQIDNEGWSKEHDDLHSSGELAKAAACYALNHTNAETIELDGEAWPWPLQWDKRGKHGELKSLVVSGALIAAEIDRIIRATGGKNE